jgi:hypothetical protein
MAGKGKMFKKSKNWKIPKNTYEIFLHFFRSRPNHMSKWSLWMVYIAGLSRKRPKSCIFRPKMDLEKAFFRPIYIRAFGRIEYYMKWLLSELEGGRKVWSKITVPLAKRGKCRGVWGDYFVGKWRAWPEMGKCSKIQKTVKFRKILIKIFYPFFRSWPDHTPKYSPYSHYIAQPSRKQQENHSMTSKMDPQKAWSRVLYIWRLVI